MADDVQLFITCILDSLYPEIGEAVVKVLRQAGVRVQFPTDQTCCGQPSFNAGLRSAARPIAEHTIRVFERTAGAILIPSGSCTAMIRHGYPELFANDLEWLPRAQAISRRVFELTEYLVDHLGVVDLGARFPGKLAYHASCHLLRELGVDRQPRSLLANIKEAQIVELPHANECCGFGGVFSIEHPEISSAMLERKIENIQSSQADLVVSCDAGCMTNINGGLARRGLPTRVVHIAEVLAQS